MRDIKFRAWIPTKKKMGVPWDLHRQATSSVPEENLYDAFPSEAVFMQYTGLKDKNEVEIYEGDILRIPAEDQWAETNYSAFEVFYHDNDCTPTDVGLVFGRMKNYGLVAGGYCGYKLIPKVMERFIVIGNIYENPELWEA